MQKIQLIKFFVRIQRINFLPSSNLIGEGSVGFVLKAQMCAKFQLMQKSFEKSQLRILRRDLIMICKLKIG